MNRVFFFHTAHYFTPRTIIFINKYAVREHTHKYILMTINQL